ncbi:hypothetical protein RO3G_14138 [Rhizopus delemar RA 99-880]|uniref:Uncharacterized protein n=1 Tax=Rhizopus delemar (strain RA 99-880 / ATCC MYA-4621 / FGSC 9543 / NRRL 43880) TaxID=246409 RepID=I1CLU7_RHIO9|nr:hypothetical protein RO3G_14138 [Rhizopus delemar RA 99-880]|eukprot:EIE89427.1 hypothetical protein RO3G_14138 [Rhizopus delemar RA 99-880]
MRLELSKKDKRSLLSGSFQKFQSNNLLHSSFLLSGYLSKIQQDIPPACVVTDAFHCLFDWEASPT